MNCRKAKESIQLQYDDELPPRARSALVRHLDSCQDCRRVQEQTALLSSAFDELAARTGSRTAAQLAFNDPPPLRWGTPMALAATVALMIGLWILFADVASRTPSGPLFVADQTDTTVVQAPVAAHRSPGANRRPATAHWGGVDPTTWLGLVLVLFGIAVIALRINEKSPGIYLKKVYKRS